MREWCLIIEKIPLRGSLNMAVDEYLFLTLGRGPETVVRFYQWERPTVSLGYSQPADGVVDRVFCQEQGIDIVRRITGGKLVLHHREVTYSICSSDTGIFSSSLAESYHLISSALIRGLVKMGLTVRLAGPPPSSYNKGNRLCFSLPALDEIAVEEKKLVGSAQKRIGGRFLQHGSIPLQPDEGMLKGVSLSKAEAGRLRMTSLSEALGRHVDFEWAVGRLVAGMAEYFDVEFRPRRIMAEEMANITKIQRERYENDNWTFGRKKRSSIDFFGSE